MIVHTFRFESFEWLFIRARQGFSVLFNTINIIPCYMRVHTGILFHLKICKENDTGKMADLIEMPLGSVSGVGLRNRVLV